MLAPSLLSADFADLKSALKTIEQNGGEIVHIDVMDGHFVPNLTLGAPIVKCIRKASSLPFDVHLMISDPYRYIPDFASAGADIITFHYESDSDVDATVDLIHSLGKKAGLAVKPKTDISVVYPYLDRLDMVLVMTVEPGFGGQSFMQDMMPKVADIRQRKPEIDIQVDGGINADTISVAAQAGANVFVSGNAIFSSPDAEATIRDFKAKAEG